MTRDACPRLMATLSLVGIVACGAANEPLAAVKHVPLGLACYPVQYIKPPFPPPSVFCPRPESFGDPEIVMLIASDGSVIDAYLTSDQSDQLHACLVAVARQWPLEPAKDCTGASMAGEFRMTWSGAFGSECVDFRGVLRSGGRTSGCS
jgi:hypothetical protein